MSFARPPLPTPLFGSFEALLLCLGILWLGAFSASPSRADVALYEGVAPVTDQGAATRRAAFPEALRHVLRKLSGLRELPPSAELDGVLERSEDLAVAFGYREDTIMLPDGTESDRLQLVASFAPPAVDELVRTLRLPRWRAEREPVVLWVVVDDRRDRALMPVEYQYEFDRMVDSAERRGLPVAWPGLPPELMEQVDVQLLWGGYTDQLVGEGTNTAAVAVVAARREGAEWNVRWTYADRSTSNSWRSRAPSLEAALDDGVQQLADLVARINTIGAAGPGRFRVELLLKDLGDSEGYARSLTYLEGLGIVDAVAVAGVGPAGVRLALELNAEPSYLDGILRQDGFFEPGDVPGVWRLAP